MYRSHVLVCGGTGCTSSGSQQIMEILKQEIEKCGLSEEVAVVQTGCHGLCAFGPSGQNSSGRGRSPQPRFLRRHGLPFSVPDACGNAEYASAANRNGGPCRQES